MLVYKNYASNNFAAFIFRKELSMNCKIFHKVFIKFYITGKTTPEIPVMFKFRKTIVRISEKAFSEMLHVWTQGEVTAIRQLADANARN
jgi:hypothetical protein